MELQNACLLDAKRDLSLHLQTLKTRIHNGSCCSSLRGWTRPFQVLCLATGGPHPSVQSVSYNLKPLDYCALAPAYAIINCVSEHPVPMFPAKRNVRENVWGVGAQSRPFRTRKNLNLRKIAFSQIYSYLFIFVQIFWNKNRVSENFRKKSDSSRIPLAKAFVR